MTKHDSELKWRHFVRLSLVPVLLFFGLLLAVGNVGAIDYCDMARDVAAKAAKTFPGDKAKGVKLFIKALSLCDKPLYQYNLGIAYYRYGNPAEAEKYLALAVAGDGSQAAWLNDYAVVIMAAGGDPEKALAAAKKAQKLAGDDRRLGPAIAETLARAELFSGAGLAALEGISAATKCWSNESRLEKAQKEIEKEFVTASLKLMQSGKRETGVAVLAKGAQFSPLAAQTLCRALAQIEPGEKSLAATARWKQRYPDELDDIWDEVVDSECLRLCNRYKSGEQRQAMYEARVLSEKYPACSELKEVEKKLFDAFTNDDATIVLAQRTRKASQKSGDVDVDRALKEMFGRKGQDRASVGDISLEIAVDQDENIRIGRKKREHGIAVVIGNQRYADRKKGVPDVDFAGRDAAIMQKYLTRTMGFSQENIITCLDATVNDFNIVFGTDTRPKQGKLYRFVKGERGKAEVFVYYVGHGAPAEKSGEAYLVPVDAEVDYIETSGYPLSLFYRNLELLPAKSVMVVLDACFSGDSAGGQLFRNISPTRLTNVSPLQELKDNSFVLCGADKNEVCAWYPEKRHSLLTYYFFEALQGHADINGDKRVTVGELYSYVSDKVSRKALR
ncbi:MAG: caspase family protein, partial [Deltaproteobacteria bacterium]|nr:caspase family protein [Candidatus Tharpella aukensis]